ncbi:MAG TPA: hypothetical protein VE152_13565 [Acidimicrobiales bacterium]|nr:hypothetical protein [Acidimicrobiales bacterium]
MSTKRPPVVAPLFRPGSLPGLRWRATSTIRRRTAYHVVWRARLPVWVVSAGLSSALLRGPWIALGPAAFEAGLAAANLWATRRRGPAQPGADTGPGEGPTPLRLLAQSPTPADTKGLGRHLRP